MTYGSVNRFGHRAIITAVLQLIDNVVDHGMNVAEATHVPRMHHQWTPDELELEPGFSPDAIASGLHRQLRH